MKIDCRSRSVVRTSLALGVLFIGANRLPAQDVIYLNSSSDLAQQTYRGGGDLEGELNCDQVTFVRHDLPAIIQNAPDADPVFAGQMRHLGKILFNAAVLEHAGALNAALQSGAMQGLEFDYAFPNGPFPPTEDRLAAYADVYGTLEDGTTGLVAKVYAYDAAQYLTRKQEVEASVGHPLDNYPVWAEHTLTNAAYVGEALVVSGAKNEVYGYAASKASFRVTSPGNVFHHGIGHAGNLTLDPASSAWFTETISTAPAPASPFTLAEARAEAQANGTYASGNLTITDLNVPPDGVVFAEGRLIVSCNGHSGSWTLVSAGDKVVLRGDGNSLTAFLDDVFALSYADRVVVNGEENLVIGEMLAPQSRFEVPGSGNTLMGTFLGTGLRIPGEDNVLSDGTHPIATP